METAAHSVSGLGLVCSYAFITDCGSKPDCSSSSAGTNDRTYLQHSSIRRRSFMSSPSTVRKR